MSILVNVVLPVFLVVGVAALAQNRLRLQAQTLSRAVFYLFGPALVFDSLAASDVSGQEFGQIAAVLILSTLILWILGALAARLLRLQGPTQAAFLAAILLMNAGNYGLSITLFAFGEEGLSRAALYFTISALLSASLGVYLAARGRAPARLALARVARVPLAYAAILGLVINLGNLTMPEPLLKGIHLLGQASIPTMLMVLGIKLADTFRSRQHALPLSALATVAAMRLLLAPAITWAAVWFLGLEPLARDVVVLESAMPTAVITTILATEFDSDPAFASLCVLFTTLASLPTVTILLNWLT